MVRVASLKHRLRHKWIARDDVATSGFVRPHSDSLLRWTLEVDVKVCSSSPNRRLPYYIQFWTRQGYLVLLTTSVIAFLGGLLCYMMATQVTDFRESIVSLLMMELEPSRVLDLHMLHDLSCHRIGKRIYLVRY